MKTNLKNWIIVKLINLINWLGNEPWSFYVDPDQVNFPNLVTELQGNPSGVRYAFYRTLLSKMNKADKIVLKKLLDKE